MRDYKCMSHSICHLNSTLTDVPKNEAVIRTGGLVPGCQVIRKQLVAPTYRQVSNDGHPADLPKRTWARTSQDPAAKITFRICDSLLLLWNSREAGCDGASYYSVTRSVFPATWRSPADCSAWRIGGSVVGSGTRHIPGELPWFYFFLARVRTCFTRAWI